MLINKSTINITKKIETLKYENSYEEERTERIETTTMSEKCDNEPVGKKLCMNECK